MRLMFSLVNTRKLEDICISERDGKGSFRKERKKERKERQKQQQL
jgi:hypothetical protein